MAYLRIILLIALTTAFVAAKHEEIRAPEKSKEIKEDGEDLKTANTFGFGYYSNPYYGGYSRYYGPSYYGGYPGYGYGYSSYGYGRGYGSHGYSPYYGGGYGYYG